MSAARAVMLNCSLKSAGETSSTEQLLDEVGSALRDCDVDVRPSIRIRDADVAPGVPRTTATATDGPPPVPRFSPSEILVIPARNAAHLARILLDRGLPAG